MLSSSKKKAGKDTAAGCACRIRVTPRKSLAAKEKVMETPAKKQKTKNEGKIMLPSGYPEKPLALRLRAVRIWGRASWMLDITAALYHESTVMRNRLRNESSFTRILRLPAIKENQISILKSHTRS